MFFLRALAAMVAADAIDRHRRERQRRAWLAEDAQRQTRNAAAAAWPDPRRGGGPAAGSELAPRHRST